MTEKRRRDEPQSGLPNGGPTSKLNRALKSIVTVQSQIPEDAFTAQTLGEQRSGSGVVIRESGLVLTIGYLITEAETRLARRRRRPGHPGPCARHRCGDRLRPRPGAGRSQMPGARARPLERGQARRSRDGRRRRGDKAGARDDRRQAGIRRLLGIFSRRGDLHLARPSVLGRRRGDRRGGQAGWHRLAACRATQREERPARHQHDRADRPSAADPRRSPHLRASQQAGAAVAWRFFGRKWRRDHRRERRRTGTGRRSGNPSRRRSRWRRRARRSKASAISTARSGVAARPGSRFRSKSSATAGRSACGCDRPTARPS